MPVALPLPSAVFTQGFRLLPVAALPPLTREGPACGLGGLGKGAALPSYLVIDLVIGVFAGKADPAKTANRG